MPLAEQRRAQLDDIVGRMEAAKESPDEIRAVVEDFKQKYSGEPAAKPERPSWGEIGHELLADNPALPWFARAGQGLIRNAVEHPVATAATAGAIAATAATGGAALPAIAAAGLGGAGGAGTAITARQLITGRPEAASDTVKTMAREGAVNAAGEGLGRAAVKAAGVVVPVALKRLIPGTARLNEEFPTLMQDIRREAIPVGESSRASAAARGERQTVDKLLATRDAARPKVAGLLTEGRAPVATGPAPVPGEMPLHVAHAQPLPLRRPPTSTMPGGGRFAEHIEGVDPVETLYASRLGSNGRPLPTLDAPPLEGAGTVLRPVKAAPGRGAPASMVDPEKVALRLGKVRGALKDRALADDGLAELSALEQKFLAGRPAPMSLLDTKNMVRAEQKLANRAYRASEQGNAATDVPALFHKAIAEGGNAEVRRIAPEIIPHDQRAQELIGIGKALRMAEQTAAQHPPTLNPFSWVGPGTMSKAVFKLDKLAPLIGSRGSIGAQQAFLARLAEFLHEGGQ